MCQRQTPIRWEPRVPQRKIRLLYDTDAKGVYDEALMDEVGFALVARCQSFLDANAARAGRARCHACGDSFPHSPDHPPAGKHRLLRCPRCGWEVTWGAYFRSIQGKQLSGAEPVLKLLRDFIRQFGAAQNPREKMITIDRVIHGFHWSLRHESTRPTAVNLIEGTMHEVVECLDDLTYGDDSTPGVRQTRAAWRTTINEVAHRWNDPRLRRAQR